MNWLLFEDEGIISPNGEEFNAFNIIPDCSPDHSRLPDCWCHPDVEVWPDNRLIINHHVMH